jgi:hypothetical protein
MINERVSASISLGEEGGTTSSKHYGDPESGATGRTPKSEMVRHEAAVSSILGP